MKTLTNTSMKIDSVFSMLNPLINLENRKKEPKVHRIELNTVKNLNISFNKNSFLNLYLEITGFSKREHIGQSFTIERPTYKNDSFFQKLFDALLEKGDILLLKHKSDDGSFFWTKGKFEVNTIDSITFTIKNELILNGNESKLNKLINTLKSLESKLDPNISTKYLEGYIEERGAISFNDYIKHYI